MAVYTDIAEDELEAVTWAMMQNARGTSGITMARNEVTIQLAAIAYGEFISGQSTTSYKQVEIPLEYRATNRTPKYIVIVAAASKYGDYFIGGEGSTLWIDEMELVYE